jgi:tRNA/tmRNA/rRNA uracil-C5-methylase (TrmA/RlmC/RlmD family)
MALAYLAQLDWKRDACWSSSRSHPALAALAVDAVRSVAARFGYRNQAKYVFGRARDSGLPVLGAFAPRSHDVVDLAGCQVVEPVLDEARQALLAVLIEKAWNPSTRSAHRRASLRRASRDRPGPGDGRPW